MTTSVNVFCSIVILDQVLIRRMAEKLHSYEEEIGKTRAILTLCTNFDKFIF